MDPQSMFAAAKASGKFDILGLIRQPVVILRLISVLTAIIVFGCISSGGRTANHVCIFHGEASTCSLAISVGVFAFLGAIVLLILDGMFDTISNVKKRRQVVIGDLAFSGLWTFLWFVSFCLLANKWTSTVDKWLHAHKVAGWQENNARAAIVFAFVSTGLWAGITFFALQRFRLGQAGLGGADAEAGAMAQAGMGGDVPGAGYTGMPTDSIGGVAPDPQLQQQAMGAGQYGQYTPTY